MVTLKPQGSRQERAVLRCARTLREVEAAWRLVYEVYVAQGIVDCNPHQIHTTPPAVGPDSCTIYAERHGRAFSTLTVIRDTARGLPLDKVMADKLEPLRAAGRGLVEAGMLAHRSAPVADGRRRLFELMRWAIWFTAHRGADDIVVGVHPRHVGFYVRAFAMDILSQTRRYPGLRASPVVLLRCRVSDRIGNRHSLRHGMAFAAEHPLARADFEHRYQFPHEELCAVPWLADKFPDILADSPRNGGHALAASPPG